MARKAEAFHCPLLTDYRFSYQPTPDRFQAQMQSIRNQGRFSSGDCGGSAKGGSNNTKARGLKIGGGREEDTPEDGQMQLLRISAPAPGMHSPGSREKIT